MFLPPAGVLPADPLDLSAPLKKILLWNGASSWGGIRSVRVRVVGPADHDCYQVDDDDYAHMQTVEMGKFSGRIRSVSRKKMFSDGLRSVESG